MTTETDLKPTEKSEDKKEVEKEEVKKAEEDAKNADEKTDDKAEKPDKDKKEKTVAPPKPTVHKVDYEKDIIYLYQFTRTPVLPSLSPYCLKVETFLRLVGLKYENVDHRLKYKSKKGQLPFVEVNGEEIADSAIIIKELSQRYNTDLDAGLSTEQRNIAHSNIVMIENHLAWAIEAYFADHCDEVVKGFKLDLKQTLQKSYPAVILNFLFKRHLKLAAKKVRAHGIGVHKPEEIEEFGRSDLKVLTDLLGSKQFFFGESPTLLDVVAFANLAQVVYLDKEVSYGLRDWLNENCENLAKFCDRMKERAFPDWDEMCSSLDLNSHLPKPPKEEEKKEEAKEKEEKAEEKDKDESEKKDVEKDNKEAEKK